MFTHLREFTAKNFGISTHDFIKGTQIKSSLKLLEKSQYWDDLKINEYRLKKLKALWTFIIANNSFYKRKYSNLIAEGYKIDNLKSITELPLLSKRELRESNLLSDDLNLRKLARAKTGGTTGPPVIVYSDIKSRSFAMGGYFRWYKWMGINYGDPIITLWGARSVLSTSLKSKLYKSIKYFMSNDLYIDSFNINDQTINQISNEIQKNKPALIKGYLSALLQLADYFNKKNISYRPKAISTTTETLLPPFREYLLDTFKCPIYDQYASTEITGVAFECNAHNGLHISNEHVIVEVLNESGDSILNEKGRIVTTDLDNYGMPFIRYEIGDMGIISTEKCSCGVKLPLLKSIDGRVADTIVLKNGSKVHGVFFTDIMQELKQYRKGNRISRFQVKQYEMGSIELFLETSIQLQAEYIEELKKALFIFFSDVKIKVVSKLENDKSGKFRYIISELTKKTSSI